ncbi:MAG: polysulfide reductase NrfD [Deltaproteobacteria bacterium]|nr:polysulfide reductase NrfD [Deltaproteobacteria bacterium]
MESSILYNIPEFANSAMPLGWPIAVYFFLTGSLAGLYITSVIATLMKKEEWQPVAKIGAVGAVVLLLTAPVLLIIDLNQPFRFWHLFFYLNPTSPLTWGSFFLAMDGVVCLAYAYFVLQGNTRMARIWGLGGLPIAIAGHGYTGFFLALSKARAFWNTALNPALFMVSAMVCGLAVMIVLINLWLRRYAPEMSPEQVEKHKGVIGTLLRILMIFIVADLFLIGSDLTVLASSDTESYAMLQLLTTGQFAIWFLGIELLLGAVLPLALLSVPKIRMIPAVQYASAALVIIGIFVMRIIIVIGGQSVPMQ